MAQAPTLSDSVQLLRTSPAARSVAYYSSMLGVLLACFKLPYDPDDPFGQHIHPQAFPGVVAITDLFTRLQKEDRDAWTRPLSKAEVSDFAYGLVLGAAACATVLGVGVARGWMSAPKWGWGQGLKPSTVLASSALTAAQTGALVANEEIIFRGYGFDTLRAAFGLPKALALSVLMFARYHGPGWKRFLGLSAAGLLLAFLRLRTGNPWFAAGFHFGWNVSQMSIFGPADGAPSLRPLQLHGPEAWIGKPGQPDPGWLQILATLAMAAIAGGALLRQLGREHGG